MNDWLQLRLQNSLDSLTHAHQRRFRRCVHSLDSVQAVVDGKRCISFASNDYLGLTHHPRVLQAFTSVAADQAGAGASALIAGRSPHHQQLENAIAAFEGTEAAILFPSGFAANVGTLTSLVRPSDAIFCDRENHASLIDGCRASGGKFFVYDRRDPDRLQHSLARRRADYDAIFLVTDAVFSMDGTTADLPQLCNIAEQYNAAVIVDEAHGTGVFGKTGRGVCELQNVENRVAVRIGTLSKAVGGLGGFVAGSEILCDWLWNAARSQFFSTALPPAVCASASAAFSVIHDDSTRRLTLADRSAFTRLLLRQHGFQTIFHPESPESSPIVAVLVGDDDLAVRISHEMLERGFFIPAVRPPTVDSGTARLRMSVCCEHSEDQIRAAVYQLRDVLSSER